MKWIKKGLIYMPTGDLWWAKSHAYLPTADLVDKDCIRIYFASFDINKYGRLGYVDLDIDDPKIILFIKQEPILDIGETGTFDDCGVTPSCVVSVLNMKHLYYFGWQRTERVPYILFAGLAISHDGGETFRKWSRVPILERTSDEPFVRSATTVIIENGIYRMWYVSGSGWIELNNSKYPAYVIRYAESSDGLCWASKNQICINYETQDEYGFGRPWVKKDGGIYKMWYSIRSKIQPYRIGYAESYDGITWTRKDNQVGIAASKTGWDSEMICFPCVVDVKGRRYMFYNGNRHGESGFGYAELEEE